MRAVSHKFSCPRVLSENHIGGVNPYTENLSEHSFLSSTSSGHGRTGTGMNTILSFPRGGGGGDTKKI